MSNTAAMSNYVDAIANLPEDAFLGSLIFFSISKADVNLEDARQNLSNAGLKTDTLRKNLRPVDAFRKATNDFKKKFPEIAGVRSELMVRPVGEDGEQAYRHLVLERADVSGGRKRRLYYDKVAELTFNRGSKDRKSGLYSGHGVEARRTDSQLPDDKPLTSEEDEWVTNMLVSYQDRYDHLLNYMDSHAVRTFVREYIYDLDGICVKESGGLYFVAQKHNDELRKLGAWVDSVGSEFRIVPLLNIGEQKAMIMEAFEDDTVLEVERLMAEIAKILQDPAREIEEKTYDAYAMRAVELASKLKEYNTMLDDRADRASGSIDIYSQQIMALTSRIKQSKAKVNAP